MEKAHALGRVAPGLKILSTAARPSQVPPFSFYKKSRSSGLIFCPRGKGAVEMSHIVRFAEGTAVEDRIAALEKYLTELQAHRDSRRGLDGVRGEQGPQGEVGPVGPSADVREVVEAAKAAMKEEFGTLHKFLNAEALAEIINHQLKLAGVIDEDGKAVLIPGPKGDTGAASTIPGPEGERGDRGERGERGDRGLKGEPGASNTPGPVGQQGERGEHGERGEVGPAGESIQGEKGEPGQSIEGPQGIPGPGLSKSDVVDVILDMKNRKSI